MDPNEHRFTDAAVRLVRESDNPDVIELFKLNYGDTYPFQEVYDGSLVKQCIYGDKNVGVVLEDAGRVVGFAAVCLGYGDYNDQVGELARLVVNPEQTGCGIGSRIITSLLEAAEEHVELAIAETRTEHSFAQRRVEEAGLTVFGFLPLYHFFNGQRENQVLYGKLLGHGMSFRSKDPPNLIPEIVPFARHVLSSMPLPGMLNNVIDCKSYEEDSFTLQPMNPLSLACLRRIKHGRIIGPLLFGAVSIDQGHSFIKRHNANYLIAFDEQGEPIGAIGFQDDETNKNVKGIELIAEGDALRGFLCRAFIDHAEQFGAELVEVNVSAYDARLQRTFYEYGFRPAAYIPTLAFHGTERLDAVKMIKLNIPYDRGKTKLTEKAKEVASIVEVGFR